MSDVAPSTRDENLIRTPWDYTAFLRGGPADGLCFAVAKPELGELRIQHDEDTWFTYKPTGQTQEVPHGPYEIVHYPVWALDGKMPRPGWDEYFTGIAEAVSRRATCPRASVGALLVSTEHRILATGYNGSAPGEPHCLDVGCAVVDGHCQRALHAEVNAIAFAARHGVSISGARLYLYIGGVGRPTVATVCRECAKVLKAAGVTWT